MPNNLEKGNIIENVLNYLSSVSNGQGELFSVDNISLAEADKLDKKYVEAVSEFIHFMDELPGGFLIYRATGDEEILYANRALVKLFCCRSLKEFREYTGNSFRGIVHPKDLVSVEMSINNQKADSY